MSKLNEGLIYGRVSFPLENLSVHRGRPDDVLCADMDYVVNYNGNIEGCGEKATGNIAGVSTFGLATDTRHPKHGVIADCQLPHHCSILSTLPSTVIIVHDYDVCLRYSDPKKKRQSNIPHFSICPIADDLYSPDQWQIIIYGSGQDSCQWLPCDLKASGEHDCDFDVLDDGCDEDDIIYFTKSVHFAVRALCLVCRMLFPNLCIHDKVIINGLLTKIVRRKPPTLRVVLQELNLQFVRAVLTILRRESCHSSTASNYCGIAINEIEDFLFMGLGRSG